MTTGRTSTSNFGVGRREGHDASGFYERFSPPQLSDDDTVHPPSAVDQIWCADARSLATDPDDGHDEGTGGAGEPRVADGSVALIVTSPPYFAGKAYEEDLSAHGVPGDYLEYLGMLRDVFAACVPKLEPGGRIAVNVANLGRKPYRSLSADVIGILEDLGLLLRGEIVWQKGKGAGGSCAWGSFQRPGNPVLRDLTERVVVASKGRFDRAVDARTRAARGMPHEGSITIDDFLEATLDVWELAPESAKRVNHPAPFPVELPLRLIELYTYRGDLVLDPFMGAGTTAVAAVRSGRHFVGFDTDPAYVDAALARVADERAGSAPDGAVPVTVPPSRTPAPARGDVEGAVAQGRKATEVAEQLLYAAGATEVTDRAQVRELGVEFDLRATGPDGRTWLVAVAGTRTGGPSGLRRTDVLWRTVAQVLLVAASDRPEGVLVLSTDHPASGSPQARALRAASTAVAGIVDLTAADATAQVAAVLGRPAAE